MNNKTEIPKEKQEEIKQDENKKNPYVLDHQNETDLIDDFGWNLIGVVSVIGILLSILRFAF